MSAAPVIAIDGPGGSGKGTIALHLARRLGWHLLDSGALYRLLACAAGRDGVGLGDAAALAELSGRIHGEFGIGADGGEVVRLDGVDVTRELRTEATGNAASRLAALPETAQPAAPSDAQSAPEPTGSEAMATAAGDDAAAARQAPTEASSDDQPTNGGNPLRGLLRILKQSKSHGADLPGSAE